MTAVTATGLLETAEDIMRSPDLVAVGAWPRAVAFLGRLALELGVEEYWLRERPGVEKATKHAQLLCLPPDSSGEASHIYGALSNACHYHPYELSPTAGELEHWLVRTGALLDRLSASDEPAR